jgi:hypothetical protein
VRYFCVIEQPPKAGQKDEKEGEAEKSRREVEI